jgi:hypothetical protein
MIAQELSLTVYQKMVESGIPFEDISLNVNRLLKDVGSTEIEWSKVIATVATAIGGGVMGGFISMMAGGGLEQDRTDPPPDSRSEALKEDLADLGKNFAWGFGGGVIFTLAGLFVNTR